MRELPLLASDRVARALLEGRQTQHRIPIRWPDWVEKKDRDRFGDGWRTKPHERVGMFKDGLPRKSFGAPWQLGDLMYVRECWAPADGRYSFVPVLYRADGDAQPILDDRWHPSIHMPKWAARTWLKVKRVWAERAQDISAEDARAEGIERVTSIGPCRSMGWKDYSGGPGFLAPQHSFASLWESLYPGSWERNDWLWCCELELDRERSEINHD